MCGASGFSSVILHHLNISLVFFCVVSGVSDWCDISRKCGLMLPVINLVCVQMCVWMLGAGR